MSAASPAIDDAMPPGSIAPCPKSKRPPCAAVVPFAAGVRWFRTPRRARVGHTGLGVVGFAALTATPGGGVQSGVDANRQGHPSSSATNPDDRRSCNLPSHCRSTCSQCVCGPAVPWPQRADCTRAVIITACQFQAVLGCLAQSRQRRGAGDCVLGRQAVTSSVGALGGRVSAETCSRLQGVCASIQTMGRLCLSLSLVGGIALVERAGRPQDKDAEAQGRRSRRRQETGKDIHPTQRT